MYICRWLPRYVYLNVHVSKFWLKFVSYHYFEYTDFGLFKGEPIMLISGHSVLLLHCSLSASMAHVQSCM